MNKWLTDKEVKKIVDVWPALTKEQRKARADAIRRYRAKERLLETEEEQEIRMSKYKNDDDDGFSSHGYNPSNRLTENDYVQACFDSNFRAYCREEDRFSERF
jgi:hypothetical protein